MKQFSDVEIQADLIDWNSLKKIDEEYQNNMTKKVDILDLIYHENQAPSNFIDSAFIDKPEPIDIFNISIIQKKSEIS